MVCVRVEVVMMVLSLYSLVACCTRLGNTDRETGETRDGNAGATKWNHDPC